MQALLEKSFATLLLFVLFLLGNEGTASAQIKPRIIGGSSTSEGNFPFMVALYSSDYGPPSQTQFCGGVLIGPRRVLTAAHCTEGVDSPGYFKIAGGSNDLESGNLQIRNVIAVHQHPEFSFYSLLPDLSVIILDQDLPGPYARIPTEAEENALAPTAVTALGWGEMSTVSSWRLPAILRQVTLPLISPITCAATMGRLVDPIFNLCAGVPASGSDEGKGTCFGDSGGPIGIVDGSGVFNQIGVTSWGLGTQCRDEHGYSVFMRTRAYKTWIEGVPNEHLGYSSTKVVGDAVEGARLRALIETPGFTPDSVSYDWYSVSEQEALVRQHGNNPTYVLSSADVGHQIYVEATIKKGTMWVKRTDDGSPAVKALSTALNTDEDLIAPEVELIKSGCRGVKCESIVLAIDNRTNTSLAKVSGRLVVSRLVKGKRFVRRITAAGELISGTSEMYRIKFRLGLSERGELRVRAIDQARNMSQRLIIPVRRNS